MFFGDAHYCKSTAVDYINSLCQISHESLPTNFSRRLVSCYYQKTKLTDSERNSGYKSGTC